MNEGVLEEPCEVGSGTPLWYNCNCADGRRRTSSRLYGKVEGSIDVPSLEDWLRDCYSVPSETKGIVECSEELVPRVFAAVLQIRVG